MNVICRLGFHDFPTRKETDERFEWVVCRRYCCIEKNLNTGQIHKMG